jgi:hypothetical protein
MVLKKLPVVPDILDTIDFMSYNNTTNVQHLISDVIEKGIKETHDDVIKNGVNVIKNGVKECIPSRHPLYNPMDFSVQYRENHRLDDVASVLEKGIKEVQPLPHKMVTWIIVTTITDKERVANLIRNMLMM